MNYIVYTLNKTDWNDFAKEEKLVTENTALLVGLLYNMGKVELVLKSNDNSQTNTVNTTAVQKSMSDANAILVEKGFKAANTDLTWAEVKEILHSNLSDLEYYRWIDMLEVETDENSIKIIAPYKEAARHVKEIYQNLIEKTIKQCLKKESSISYGT